MCRGCEREKQTERSTETEIARGRGVREKKDFLDTFRHYC